MYRRYFGPSDQQPVVVVSPRCQFLGSLGWYCRIVSRLLLLYDEDVGGAVAAQLEVTNCDLKFWSSARAERSGKVGYFSSRSAVKPMPRRLGGIGFMSSRIAERIAAIALSWEANFFSSRASS